MISAGVRFANLGKRQYFDSFAIETRLHKGIRASRMCVIIANYLSRKRFELVPICHQFMLTGYFLPLQTFGYFSFFAALVFLG